MTQAQVIEGVSKQHFLEKLIQRSNLMEELIVVFTALCRIDANKVAASPLKLKTGLSKYVLMLES